jgi:hypothetical protein
MLYAGLDLSRKRLDFHLLEQEGAAGEGAGVLRLALEREPPVFQRALHATQARLRLTACCGKGRSPGASASPALAISSALA